MDNHFNIKLINFGLTFNNDDSRILVKDIKLSEKSIPILINQRFNTWVSLPDDRDNEIGYADLYTENFNLFADCYIDKGIMVTQPKHDHIIIRSPRGYLLSFSSLSLHVDHMIYEVGEQDLHIPKILNAQIKSLSPVMHLADPGVFICTEYVDKNSRDSKQSIIFTGQNIDKFILD